MALAEFPTIERYEAESLWAGKQRGRAEYGSLSHCIGTGRAKCRACGQRIAKGDAAVSFMFDFKGCGSWTAVQCYIHASNCLDQGVAVDPVERS